MPVSGSSSDMSGPASCSFRSAPLKAKGSCTVPTSETRVGPLAILRSTGYGVAASRSDSKAPPTNWAVIGWRA